MRIAVNCLSINPNNTGGGEVFLKNLLDNLHVVDASNEYILLVTEINEHIFNINSNNFKKIVLKNATTSPFHRFFNEQIIIPFLIKRYAINILYSPANVCSVLAPCKRVLQIQSISHEYFPEEFSRLKALYLKVFVTLSARLSHKIIAVSNDAKKSICNKLKVDEGKITVIYEGVSGSLIEGLNENSEMCPLAQHNIKKPYILCVGFLYGHKNFDKAIMAFKALKEKYGLQHKLVIVGKDYMSTKKQLVALSKNLNLMDDVIFTGFIPHYKIGIIYKNADLFVNLSSLESFCLPIVEAMSFGVPVVASFCSAMPEITQGAAILVNPTDINEIAEAIYRFIDDENLRKKMVKMGYEIVKGFSWKETAQKTLKTFEEARLL